MFGGVSGTPVVRIIVNDENHVDFDIQGDKISGAIKTVSIPPDVDTTLSWSAGKPVSIVDTGYGKTWTHTLSWSGDELDSIATVIT